jgi:hypothetical protein
MRRRIPPALLFVAAAVLTAACGKLLSPPPRPRTDGYAGIVTVRAGGTELAKFSLAVRGEAVRRSTSEAEDAPYFVRETSGGEVLEVNPSTKSYRTGTTEALLAQLDDFPLGPDFNHAAEANRRGIREYNRESDAVFAGNACNIWRYADRPDAVDSPTTTYWMTPALDGIVVRKERAVPKADGTEAKSYVELTQVRAGIEPEFFRVPEGFRREVVPAP